MRYSTIIEKWCQSLDKVVQHYGVLLTDLNKAFDFLTHDLLIAILYADGFDIPAISLLHRQDRSYIYSPCEEILFGVLQASSLGPLLSHFFK